MQPSGKERKKKKKYIYISNELFWPGRTCGGSRGQLTASPLSQLPPEALAEHQGWIWPEMPPSQTDHFSETNTACQPGLSVQPLAASINLAPPLPVPAPSHDGLREALSHHGCQSNFKVHSPGVTRVKYVSQSRREWLEMEESHWGSVGIASNGFWAPVSWYIIAAKHHLL